MLTIDVIKWIYLIKHLPRQAHSQAPKNNKRLWLLLKITSGKGFLSDSIKFVLSILNMILSAADLA